MLKDLQYERVDLLNEKLVVIPVMNDKAGEVKQEYAIEYHCYSCGNHLELKKEDAKVCSCGSVEIYAV